MAKVRYETHSWKDADRQRLYYVCWKDLPRRIYNAFGPREAVERYRADMNLSQSKESSEFTILEVQQSGKSSSND